MLFGKAGILVEMNNLMLICTEFVLLQVLYMKNIYFSSFLLLQDVRDISGPVLLQILHFLQEVCSSAVFIPKGHAISPQVTRPTCNLQTKSTELSLNDKLKLLDSLEGR